MGAVDGPDLRPEALQAGENVQVIREGRAATDDADNAFPRGVRPVQLGQVPPQAGVDVLGYNLGAGVLPEVEA